MKELVPTTRKSRSVGRFGLALAALIAVAAVATPAAADHHGGASFSLGFTTAPAYPYYYAPPPRYYYAPPPRYYYAPPPAYYYAPPPPAYYYSPGVNFGVTVPLGSHH
jgi:hypothetical protein